MLRFVKPIILLIALIILPQALRAEDAAKAAPILFETRHLDLIDKGGEVTYQFDKKGSDERLVGKDYSDKLKLSVEKINDKGERDVVFQVFSGDNARDPQRWPELTINPLLVWYLDRAVGTYNSLAGGNQMYLKGRFRAALADKAKLEEVKFTFNGKEVSGYKVTVAPYLDDPAAKKMKGFENSVFTIICSKDVPGYFADLEANYVSSEAAAPKVVEHVKLVGMGDVK